MTEPTPGTYECPGCGRQESTELFLMYCCDDDEARNRGVYRGIN